MSIEADAILDIQSQGLEDRIACLLVRACRALWAVYCRPSNSPCVLSLASMIPSAEAQLLKVGFLPSLECEPIYRVAFLGSRGEWFGFNLPKRGPKEGVAKWHPLPPFVRQALEDAINGWEDTTWTIT